MFANRTFNKVFLIGLSRTGITSLIKALTILDISIKKFPLIYTNIINNDYRLSDLKYFDGLGDTPIPAIYEQLDGVYPNSKFILTNRKKSEWLESCKFYFNKKDDYYSCSPDKLVFYSKYRKIVYGCGSFEEELFSSTFDSHNESVARYFYTSPEKLLIVDSPHKLNWVSVCGFLNKEVPKIPFPHLNEREFVEKKFSSRRKLIR